MKSVLQVTLALSVMILSGCAGLFGEGTLAGQIRSVLAVQVAGTYSVTITKDGKVLAIETWECTQDAGKLTGCHKVPQ